MNKSTSNFQPVLLGSDFNVYGMARSFHEEYQLKSTALCSVQLAPTMYSKIVDVHVLPGLNQEEHFVQLLTDFYQQQKVDNCTYLLIPCGDTYAKLLSKFQNKLSDMYRFSTIPFSTYQKLENKATFYEICQQFDIPYPNTVKIMKNTIENYEQIIHRLPFSFPVILKPSDSISYLEINFEGKKKAYIIDDDLTLLNTIQLIFKSGYKESLLIQDFIPGSDDQMRVLNAYVDQHHRIRLMFLGNPILEDPSPASIGNYVAIIPDFQPEIFDNIQRLLEGINYTGFANFDLKFDERDKHFKLFEINLRQGRSSFFVTLNGYNLAKYLTEDLIYGVAFNQTEFGRGNKLWLGAPVPVIMKYLSNQTLKKRVKKYLWKHQYGTTNFYRKDTSIRHYLLQHYSFYYYRKKFRKNFKKKSG